MRIKRKDFVPKHKCCRSIHSIILLIILLSITVIISSAWYVHNIMQWQMNNTSTFTNQNTLIPSKNGHHMNNITIIKTHQIIPFTKNIQNHNNISLVISDDIEPRIQKSDAILHSTAWGHPIVLEEYNLIFFTIPKVACSEWKRLFRRMMGYKDTKYDIHDPSKNGLKYIYHYNAKQIQEMMTSNEWTRAVFVREPKERVLSGFLDKFVTHPNYFRRRCCSKRTPEILKECKLKQSEGDFDYFLQRTKDCHDEHWNPQSKKIDEKWWPTINFVGYMVGDDSQLIEKYAKNLLESMISKKDGLSAWEKYGVSGWGLNKTQCFLQSNNANHATDAHDKLRKYYTKCNEQFVERRWRAEWESPFLHFTEFSLYPEQSYNNHVENCPI